MTRLVHSRKRQPETPTAAQLFVILWQTIAEVIGTAATATVLRRSARRAAARGADIAGLAFDRQEFEYTYVLPPSWNAVDDAAVDALKSVVDELVTVLHELTGVVLVRRLEMNAALTAAKLFEPRDQSEGT
jgi:hypothetical protein